MGNGTSDPKQHAHELIDRMAPGQVSAVVPLLEIILDPLARTLASAPYDDEPLSAEEAREVEEPRLRSHAAKASPTKRFLPSSG
jgi:hypothetical protein